MKQERRRPYSQTAQYAHFLISEIGEPVRFRRIYKDRNRYKRPHQSPQECARRVEQLYHQQIVSEHEKGYPPIY